MIPMHHRPAHCLREALSQKRIGVKELTSLYLNRIHTVGGKNGVNAVCETDESALEQARALDNQPFDESRPLFGLPVLIKDNIDVRGLHTTAGSVALSGHIASADAPIVARLRAGGAIILGKTNMTEFANYMTDGLPNGFSSRGGQVLNAYHPKKNPGGSSTGSAVAVSAGLCAAAIGTDTCFSIIGCASENGVTGLKPQGGMLPSQGIVPICFALDTAGPLTRDFEDAHMVYSAMRGLPPAPLSPAPVRSLRIAVNIHMRESVSPEQLARYGSLLAALKSEGARIEEICQPSAAECRRALMRYAFKHDLQAYLAASAAPRRTLSEILAYYEEEPETRMPYGVTVLKAAQEIASGKLDEAEYAEALTEQKRLRCEVLRLLAPYDACIMTGSTDIMHTVNLPCATLRLCMAADRTPRGLILYGADETRLHNAAAAIERLCPGVVPPEL